MKERCSWRRASSFDVTTPTETELIEILFKRTGIVMRAACTLLLRLGDAVRELAQVLLIRVVFSEETAISAQTIIV